MFFSAHTQTLKYLIVYMMYQIVKLVEFRIILFDDELKMNKI